MGDEERSLVEVAAVVEVDVDDAAAGGLSLVRLGRRLRLRDASFFEVVAANRASMNMSDSMRTEAGGGLKKTVKVDN